MTDATENDCPMPFRLPNRTAALALTLALVPLAAGLPAAAQEADPAPAASGDGPPPADRAPDSDADAGAPETTRPEVRALSPAEIRQLVELDGEDAIVGGVPAGELEGMRIENARRETVGEVAAVLGRPGGAVRAFAVDVDAGWFDTGGERIVVPAALLALDHGRRYMTTVMTPEQVGGLPAWPVD